MTSAEKKVLGKCAICGREIYEDDKYVQCSICGALMHESCIDREILEDSEGNILCPYDAALAALDWFDAVITTYIGSLKSSENKEKLQDLVKRLENYIKIIEESTE